MLYKGDANNAQNGGVVITQVTVAAAATSGTATADTTLIGGDVIGIVPTLNQDQFVDSVAIDADGVITVTLAAAATANNVFNVAVLTATGN